MFPASHPDKMGIGSRGGLLLPHALGSKDENKLNDPNVDLGR
jgi:hypothetical protein